MLLVICLVFLCIDIYVAPKAVFAILRYDRHARFLLFQLWGLTDGYNYAASHFKVSMLLGF